MPGPAPKDPEKRQRANKASTRATLTASDLPVSGVPDMGTLESEEWHPLAVAWWEDVWSSPMATQYVKADRHTLYRLLLMVQEYWMRPNTELSKDIDKAQQAFGLTPLDRRRLEWIVENPRPAAPARRELDPDAPANVVAFKDPLSALR